MDPADDLIEVLAATKAGLLRWRQVGGDRYEASLGEALFAIEYRYPLFSDSDTEGSDRGVAVVELPLVGKWQFFAGSAGMGLTWEILAVNLQPWREHNEWIAERRQALRALFKSARA